jgi:hypothetical protein
MIRRLKLHGRISAPSSLVQSSPNHCCFSSQTSNHRTRIGIGGSKLSQIGNSSFYASVINTALRNGVTTFEAGLGREEHLSKAYQEAILSESNDLTKLPTMLTARFGYRNPTEDTERSFPRDILLEQQASNTSPVFHNISREYCEHCLSSSPLVQLRRENPNIHLLYMAHNPEVQATFLSEKGAPSNEIHDWVKECLTDAFVGLEKACAENVIDSYGICSNGLSLPEGHPLHLGWNLILSAAHDAVDKVYGSSSNIEAHLSTLQLPANLLETQGLDVARNVKEFLISPEKHETLQNLPSSLNIFLTRPLTSYPHPDRGTGTSYPFKLVDYPIPDDYEDLNSPVSWTHEIKSSTPLSYIPIMNKVLSHFDATHVMEAADKENRQLTVEERETIDGCRLLQSMIHDLNANLSSGSLKSFIAYEDELYKKVVPLINGTFEELDEESSSLLQKFFKAHGGKI